MVKKEDSTAVNAIIAILLIIGAVLVWQWYSTKQSPFAFGQGGMEAALQKDRILERVQLSPSPIIGSIEAKQIEVDEQRRKIIESGAYAIIGAYPDPLDPNADWTLEPTKEVAEYLIKSEWYEDEMADIKKAHDLEVAFCEGQVSLLSTLLKECQEK